MSERTSHRRQARHRRQAEVRANVSVLDKTCYGRCSSQCDECHDIDNCVEATTQYGDLLLCALCRRNHPSTPPWWVDPESGEYIDVRTGRVL